MNFDKFKSVLSLAEQRICTYCSFCEPVRAVGERERERERELSFGIQIHGGKKKKRKKKKKRGGGGGEGGESGNLGGSVFISLCQHRTHDRRKY